MSEIFINSIKANASSNELSEKIKDVFLKASDNLSWLSSGDTVLLKPALNSSGPYPVTTHPQSLLTIAEILEEKGANVIVGDQSGMEHVLNDKSGSYKKSSKELFEESGMGKGNNLKFIGFEEEGWEEGFFNYQDSASSWKNGFYVTKWIQKADHIVNLPRLSTHIISGVTLGFKNMVGLLREDSRMNFHANGPFFFAIKIFGKKAKLDKSDDHSNAFFQKMVDINLAVKEKLRVTLFTGTQAQVTFGPGKYSIPLGKSGLFPAYVVTPDTGLVFASSDHVATEVLAIAFLTILYSGAPWFRKFQYRVSQLMNNSVKELGTYNVWEDPFVSRALKIGLGSGLINPQYTTTPDELQNQLNNLIQRKN
jgi:uncharacterized protein (DUF362 family)